MNESLNLTRLWSPIGQQRSGPVKVVKRVGKLAYELAIPTHLNIHNVASVAQLEPCPNEADPFDRKDQIYEPGPVDESNPEWHGYEIEKLMGKRYRKYGTGPKLKE